MNLKKLYIFPLGLLLSLILILSAAPLAIADDGPPPPANAAKAAVLINPADGRVLYSKNPDLQLPMASTTKMMTALLIAEDGHDMNDKVTCSQRCAEVGESSIYLVAGETLTVQEMLNGMLIPSGNDAATALAEYDAGSFDAFVDKMNKRAAELGMTNTHFVTPHGLDAPGHFTSAADFAKLGAEVMKHEELREIVKRSVFNIPGYGNPTGRTLINTNHMLDRYSFIDGIKTGYTDDAGQCIVISAEENGVSLILAYLGGPSLAQRDEDVYNMIRFGFDSYVDRQVIKSGEQYAALDLPFSRDEKLGLVASSDLSKHVFVRDEVEERLVLPEEPTLPIHKGDKVGLVEAYDGDTMLGSAYLTAADDASAPGFSDRVTYYLSSIFHVFGTVALWLTHGCLREVLAG